jgi:hypothetical protein
VPKSWSSIPREGAALSFPAVMTPTVGPDRSRGLCRLCTSYRFDSPLVFKPSCPEKRSKSRLFEVHARISTHYPSEALRNGSISFSRVTKTLPENAQRDQDGESRVYSVGCSPMSAFLLRETAARKIAHAKEPCSKMHSLTSRLLMALGVVSWMSCRRSILVHLPLAPVLTLISTHHRKPTDHPSGLTVPHSTQSSCVLLLPGFGPGPGTLRGLPRRFSGNPGDY